MSDLTGVSGAPVGNSRDSLGPSSGVSPVLSYPNASPSLLFTGALGNRLGKRADRYFRMPERNSDNHCSEQQCVGQWPMPLDRKCGKVKQIQESQQFS